MILAMLWLACSGPSTPMGPDQTPVVRVQERLAVDLDAVLPTDVLVRPDGTLLVLDGYEGQILAIEGDQRRVWAAGVGRATRLAGVDDGVWAAVPGLGDDPGLLVHLDASGALVALLSPHTSEGAALHPVDLVALNGYFLLADRAGGLYRMDPGTGVATRAEAPLRRVVDLSPAADGALAVDTLAHRVHAVDAMGVADEGFGRSGLNVGQLARPTAAAWIDDNDIAVSDAELGAVQIFEPDGDVVGVLATAAGPLSLGHPVAVRRGAEPGTLVVLEAEPARLRVFALDGPLPPAPPRALLRTPLTTAAEREPGGACLQCHDGLVMDSREVWDPARRHHPVGVVPERPLPEGFALDADGALTCTTCHAPHGTIAGEEAALPLVRHASVSTPLERLGQDVDGLCTACHSDAPHIGGGVGAVGGKGHPTGDALLRALAARGDTTLPAKSTCLSCHAVHGAKGKDLTRDPGDGTACLGCHPAVGDPGHNHPLGRVPGSDLLANHHDARVMLSSAGGIGCLSCHDLDSGAAALARRLDKGAPACMDCHTAREDLAGSPHAKLAKGGLPTCVACHEVHGGDPARTLLAATPSPGDPAGCLSCHDGHSGGARPGAVGHPVDGRAVRGQDPLTCLSCHDPHAAEAPTAATCQGCHAEEARAAERGGHGAADCLDCHPAHAEPSVPKGQNPATARCLACHAAGQEAPNVVAYAHPAPVFTEGGPRWSALGGFPLYDAKGEAVTPGQSGEMSCQSCHLTHGPEGGDHLRRPEGWKEACASCHGQDTLVLYRYFHDPARREDLLGEDP